MNDFNGWVYFTMAMAGLVIPVMAAISGDVGQKVGAPTAAFTIFLSAALIGGIFAILNGGLRYEAIGNAITPGLLGGAILSFYLLSMTIVGPKIGIGTAVLLVLLGQIASSVAIDTFGLLGAPRTPINSMRVLGVLLVAIGVALARRPMS